MSGSLSGAGGVGGLLSCIQHSLWSTPPHQATKFTTHFVYCDGNGNVVDLVGMSTNARTVLAHYEYDPFGNTTAKEGSYADNNEFRFSTKRYNAQWGLYDYGYRHYSPDLGRWMSRDPVSAKDCVNLYEAFNNKAIRAKWGQAYTVHQQLTKEGRNAIIDTWHDHCV